MRVFRVRSDQFAELEGLPAALPEGGFLWIGCSRQVLGHRLGEIQEGLQRWTGAALVDLHVSDLLNAQLPSHFDYTSWYDLMVFRRLAPGGGAAGTGTHEGDHDTPAVTPVDTSPVGFAVFERVLLTVHSDDCAVRDYFAQRLSGLGPPIDARSSGRLPLSPADLMLRMVNHMVDSYLDLRRLLTRQFGELQERLLDPRARAVNWRIVLDARNALHLLEDTCEDQRSAVQEWIDALDEWSAPQGAPAQRERELLRVRSRDVLEHIERVLTHVRRLEQSAETAVQMHFSAIGHRTNQIMRTLTVLTAIFLPLNLITGFFGMNFDALPLIHRATGVWIALTVMALVGIGLAAFFWRKRYLGASVRP